MASFDDNEFHPVTLASDTTDLQAGAFSRIGDALAKGIPAAAVSGGLSIWNTVQDYTGGDKVDVTAKLRSMDGAMADYYQENQSAIDMAGFVATSIIPGALGVKALRLARAGAAETTIGRALNLTTSKRDEYLTKALQETAESGGTIKGILSQTRLKHLGWEVADNALTSTAAELMIAATMNDSPVFDGNTLGDFGWNVALGAGVGGVIGGALSSVAAKGVLKQAQTAIEGQKRMVDTLFDPAQLGLTKGTETLLFAEEIAKLPKEFLDVPFSYRYDGATKSVVLEAAGALEQAQKRAIKTAEEKLALKFNELADGNTLIGQEYFNFLKRGMEASRAAGLDADETIGKISGYLNNVSGIKHIDVDRMAVDARKFYVNLEPTGLEDMFSTTRMRGKTGKSAYVLSEGVEAVDLNVIKLGDSGFPSPTAAFKAGHEADVILLPSGRAAINPFSENIQRLAENPNRIRMFADLNTGTLSEEAVVHFADTVAKGTVKQSLGGIEAGGKFFKQNAEELADISKSPLEASARWAWASQLDLTAFRNTVGDTLNTRDLPMLSRFTELAKEYGNAAVSKIKIVDGEYTATIDDIVDLTDFLRDTKLTVLQEQLGKGVSYDLRHIAAHTNSSVDFLEDAITRNFVPPRTAAEIIPDLPTIDALRPKTIQVEWEFSKVAKLLDPIEAYKQNYGPAFQATVQLSKEYQLATRQLINDNAANAALGADANLFWTAPKDLSLEAAQGGAGAGLATASNAGYAEKAKLWVQDTGKNVALVSQRRRDAVVETLAPHINALRGNAQASAELGVLTTALRKSEFRYVIDPDDATRLISTDTMRMMAKENVDADTAIQMLNMQAQVAGKKLRVPHALEVKSGEVVDFLRDHASINESRQGRFTVLHNATGLSRADMVPGTIYVPPVNTAKYPYHAFVRTKEKIGIASETTMITARTEDELRSIAAQIEGDKYDVLYKKDTDMYFKAKGEYDYEHTLNESRINSDLARTGKLADHLPETRLENVMTDYLEFHSRQEEKLVRTAVQVKNRQFFSELQFLSDNYRVVSESVARGIGSMFKKRVEDPFADYVKTALNISKQQEFPLLDSLNEFVDKLGVSAGEAYQKAFDGARKGDVSWQEADSIANRFGLGTPYADTNDSVRAYLAANTSMPKNIIKETFQKANMMLANFTLRLDFANSIVNIISTPIMLGTEVSSIKRMIANDPTLSAELNALMSVKVPGKEFSVPSTTGLIGKAISNFFGADKVARMEHYRGIGAIKDVSKLYHEALDDLSFSPAFSPNHWYNKVNGAVDKMANFTGNNFSEDLTRFISADVMKQITDPLVAAGRFSAREQDAWISTFVNRVQGNYVTSQRPVVFQGTTGAAVSLFQTYAFNVLQQLHRHVESGDKRTLAVFAGLQSTVFGFNGLPFFDAVNTHLIGGMIANNPEHKDAYNMLPSFNKELGDWMLYGTASAFPLFSGAMPALYTRGDINPRHITVLPTSIGEVPAVSASLKLIDTIVGFGKNVAGGVDLSSAMLQGLEHQGWNRPLAGFAQLLAGRSTTSKGSLISAANDLQATSWLGSLAERSVEYGGAARLMGARPMDEAVALNQMYRNKTYEALDKARLANLGGIVKSKLHNGEVPSNAELDGFMEKYARTGGRIENFSQFMQRAMKDANVSVVNQTASKLGSPYGRKMQQIMGGDSLPDYWNSPTVNGPGEGSIE